MFRNPDSPIMRAWEMLRMAFVAHARKFEIIKLIAAFIVLGHVQACILGISSIVAEQRAATWWGTLGYCFPDQAADASGSTSGASSSAARVPRSCARRGLAPGLRRMGCTSSRRCGNFHAGLFLQPLHSTLATVRRSPEVSSRWPP